MLWVSGNGNRGLPAARGAVAPVLGGVVLVALGAFLLLRFPPEVYAIYPVCPVWRVFHVQCPGCGATRALADLLHGDLRGALRQNALTSVLLPLLGFFLVERSLFPARRRTFTDEHIAVALLLVALVFGVVRNLL